MLSSKADIISSLRKEVLSLQGFKTMGNNFELDSSLGSINKAFPNNSFPTAAVHEFIYTGAENTAVTTAFVTGLLSGLMKKTGITIWIGSCRSLFPPALQAFGIIPDHVIFIELQKEKEILWAIEEALRYDGLAAVVGQLSELSFTASRRLQLAVEQSKVTGFILRRAPRNMMTTACVTRWKITSLPSMQKDELPGVGFPRWNVELLKVRNGKPGSWQIEYHQGKFQHIYKVAALPIFQQKQTG
jgi:protein ImuA